jgi:hypothetical protein
MTTVFDAGGSGSAKASWALMDRARADTFACAIDAQKLRRYAGLGLIDPKKRTGIGAHPESQKRQ